MPGKQLHSWNTCSDGDQLTTKPIEEIEIGDTVWSSNPQTGETGPAEVVDTITGNGEKTLVEISIDSEKVTATSDHPFWVASQQKWVAAQDLTVGDQLETVDATQAFVTAIRSWTANEPVYNLTISDTHTYYVSSGAQAFLVHNDLAECPLIDLRSADAKKKQYIQYTNTKFPGPSTDEWIQTKKAFKTKTDEIIEESADMLGDVNAKGGVYVLIDREGVVRRTGKAKDFNQRKKDHDRTYGKDNKNFDGTLMMVRVVGTDSESLRRGLEIGLFDSYYDTAWKEQDLDAIIPGQNKQRAVHPVRAKFYNYYRHHANEFLKVE